MMDLKLINLPCQMTLETRLKMEFIDFLVRNAFTTEQNQDGTFQNTRVQNMWVTCKIGARLSYSVLEERLHHQVDQNTLIKARIIELERTVAALENLPKAGESIS